MNHKLDTIAAVSTAPGEAGIAVIRISGPRSLAVADKIFRCQPPGPSKRPAPALVYGRVVGGANVIDEAILLVMRAPRSYTREDVVEFQCHGGNMSAKRILQAVLRENIRLAEPGEFTKRAFLNGRLDLLQAEAVLDLIKSQTDLSAALAIEQMQGSLSSLFNCTYDNILKSLADLEASLDLDEDELPDAFLPGIILNLNEAIQKINAALATWDDGHLIRDGALVVISGGPNVGKSTLLNALLGKERVIVSPIPGTTRDVIEETLIIDGIPVRLVDTAGLRPTECAIEQQGVIRAVQQAARADIILYVLDASQPLLEEDDKRIKSLNKNRTLLVLNKTDLGLAVQTDGIKEYNFIITQAIHNKGISNIKSMIIKILGAAASHPHNFVISMRHQNILTAARNCLLEAVDILQARNESEIVLAASKIKSALDHLGQATGRNYYPELLDSIFNKFCVGK